MKVGLCCIGRLENRYIREFVEHYKSIGFDNIFLYDNNHDGEERFEDAISDYIDNGFVEVTDFRNIEAAQLLAYNDCYKKHGNDYDWIAFFDVDEFLTLVQDKNIKDYLDRFKDVDVVKVNWMIFTDNNLVTDDGRGCLERFTEPMEYDKHVTYNFPQNYHVKSIVRGGGGIENFTWTATPHTPNMPNLKYCDSIGNSSTQSPFQPYNFETVYIKHFTTKTIYEWFNNKRKRGLGDRTYADFVKIFGVGDFFKINSRTKQKEDFIAKYEQENSYFPKKNNVRLFICTHKEFEPQVFSDSYKILNAKKIESDSVLKDDFYSEIYSYLYGIKNEDLRDYVGFCHYRRYWKFMDKIPDLDEVFKGVDVIVPKPLYFRRTLRETYGLCHNIEDYDLMGKIIEEKYPQYYEKFKTFSECHVMFPCNMFIMKKEDFLEYIDFVKGVLDEWVSRVGTDIMGRIEANKDKYLKDFAPNDTVEYQYRIGGYLAERLTNIFIMTKFKKVAMNEIILTEQKYASEKNKVTKINKDKKDEQKD